VSRLQASAPQVEGLGAIGAVAQSARDDELDLAVQADVLQRGAGLSGGPGDGLLQPQELYAFVSHPPRLLMIGSRDRIATDVIVHQQDHTAQAQ
jgi:hypothetical protein